MREEFRKFVAENMTVEDLPTEDMRLLAKDCGIETIVKLLENYHGGSHLYIPKFWQKRIARRYIMANASKSINKLARDTGFSDAFVLQTLNMKASDVNGRQSTIFDYEDGDPAMKSQGK